MAGAHIKRTPLLLGNKVKKGQHLLLWENPEFIQISQNILEEL